MFTMLDDEQSAAHGLTSGGTGAKLARAVVIVTGVSALVASLISFLWVLHICSCSVHVDTKSNQGNMAANEELSQASPTTLCDSNTPHGTNILGVILRKRYVAESCLLSRSSPRYL